MFSVILTPALAKVVTGDDDEYVSRSIYSYRAEINTIMRRHSIKSSHLFDMLAIFAFHRPRLGEWLSGADEIT